MDISFAFRKIQKSIAGLSILAVLTSLVSFTGIASADTFPDVDSDHYAYDAVDAASDEGWMTGYDNGDFGVDDTLTRGQAAKLLVAGSDLDTVEDCETDFTDVPTSYSLYDYVCSAEAYGFVGGYTDSDGDATGEYGPNDSVNRAQFAKMVVEAFGLASVDDALDEFPDVDEGVWYEESDTWYVSTAWAWSVVNGYENGNYYPAYDVTRGQAAIMVNNAQEPEWRVDAGDDDDDDTTVSEGDLTVAVSSDSPDAMTIPSNATSVELAAWDFTANGGDVTVDSLSVHHYGITSLASTHQVYLYEGGNRLTSGTTVGSTNNEATFTYDIDVASGETRTISVRMDMGDYTATGEVGIEIASASKVDAGDATVDGDFPAQGAKHTISTTDAGTVTIEKNGTVSNSQVGQDDATIGKFKITSATEAAGLEELGVYLSGSVNTSDVENFKLYVSGDDAEPLAEVAAVDDLDVIRFAIESDAGSDECENSDGYCIAKGGSKSFYITADFNTGRTDDTVEVYVDQSTDVFARGALYGSGMQVVRTAYDGNANSCNATTDADCSYSTLEGGDITISSNGPAAGDIATNGRDVALLDFSIVSVTDVTFDSFPISLDASEAAADTTEGLVDATTANFTDIKISNTDTGSALFAGVDSTVFKLTSVTGTTIDETITGDAAQSYHLYTDDFEMAAGDELNLSLTADVRNLATLDDMTIVATLDLGTTYPQLKDVNNKTLTNSTALVPSSAITGKTMTVQVPSLALSLASTPVANGTTYVKGSDDVEFTGIVMTCGDASDCKVTSVSLIGTIDETGATTAAAAFATTAGTPGIDNAVNLNSIVGNVWLVDDEGVMVAGSDKSVTASTGLVTMDNLDIDIEAGSSPVYTVVGDIKSDAFKNGDADGVAFKITAASNVVAEDAEGNTINPTGTVNHPSVTTASTWVVVSNGGSITVAVDAATAREDIVVAGTSDVDVSTFKFTTTAEGFTVNKLAFNADQNGVSSADSDLGEYDNQVSKVYLTYTDSTGAEVTEDASLVAGNVTFSALDLYIGKDDSETVTVTADLNSIASGEATAGDHVRLDMAFNNFEALAEDSGETYKADKMDSAVAATSDLDFGTPTWTAAGCDANGIHTTAAVGSTNAIVVDGCGTNIFPVGTLILSDAATAQTWTDTEDSIFVLTATSTATLLTATTLDDDDASIADTVEFSYSLPGDGFLTSTNPMVVYESMPTLTLAASSPSGTRTVSADDSAFIFSVSSNASELVQIRAAVEENDILLDGLGTPCDDAGMAAGDATVGDHIDGLSATCILDSDAAGDTFVWSTSGTALQDYARVNFWIQVEGSAPEFADLKILTSSAQGTVDDATTQETTLSTAACGSDSATNVFATTEWYNCDLAMPAGTDSGDLFFGIEIHESTELANTNTIYVDELKFYNDKIRVDMSTDTTDIDTYANNTSNAAAPSAADLKDGNTTLATGYWSTTTNGATATNSATVTFIPTTAMEIAKGTTETYTMHIDSADLLEEESGSDDPVVFSIDSGSSSDLTVTAGDFWWNETNALTAAGISASTIQWLGDVTSKLSGNTLVY